MRSSLMAVAALFALSGCIIHADSMGEQPAGASRSGDINFLWSFEGRSCSQTPEVDKVRVRLAGARGVEKLENNGYFLCSWLGTDGVMLKNFAPGTYSYSIDALDSAGKALYSASGAITVNGNITVPVQLAAVFGKVQIFWTFAGKTCARADIAGPVTKVAITLNNDFQNQVVWPCSVAGIEGVAAELGLGSYSVQVDGIVAVRDPVTNAVQEQTWYSATANATVSAGQTKNLALNLDPVAAGATFLPVLMSRAGQPLGCAAAGVKSLWIQLTDWNGQSTPGFVDDCATYETAGFYWSWVLAAQAYDDRAQAWKGTWQVRIQGWNASPNPVVLYEGAAQVPVIAGLRDQTFPVTLLPR